jgi:hypothetical protein
MNREAKVTLVGSAIFLLIWSRASGSLPSQSTIYPWCLAFIMALAGIWPAGYNLLIVAGWSKAQPFILWVGGDIPRPTDRPLSLTASTIIMAMWGAFFLYVLSDRLLYAG